MNTLSFKREMDLGELGQKEGDRIEETTAGIRGAATAEGTGTGQRLADDSRGTPRSPSADH